MKDTSLYVLILATIFYPLMARKDQTSIDEYGYFYIDKNKKGI